MPRLVNPGIGDYADRLTIVALKILFGTAAGKDVTHFINERNVLVTKIHARESGPWLEHLVGLAAVNAALWHAEDDLRAMRGVGATTTDRSVQDPAFEAASRLAFRIQDLNDQRAALVQKINEEAGDHLGVEKLA